MQSLVFLNYSSTKYLERISPDRDLLCFVISQTPVYSAFIDLLVLLYFTRFSYLKPP